MLLDSNLVRKAASLFGFSGVCLGAFGAHALKAQLTQRNTLTTWKTAVLYQLVHSVGLLALSFAPKEINTGAAASLWIVGTCLFSGSLYGLALGGPKILGPVTPLGGLVLIGGWAMLFFASENGKSA